MVLDAGALLALERNDRDLVALVKLERSRQGSPVTHGGVIGQVWRGGRGRQVNLARLLAGVEVRPLDDGLGRLAGALLGSAGGADVIDAAVVLLAHDGDDIYTSDVTDLAVLVEASGTYAELIPV